MDLRSSHKEKPSPRLRFSLTRAMSTDIDQGERAGMFRRPLWRKNRQRASKRGPERPSHRPICPLRKEKSMEEDWAATSEEEKQQTKRSEDILYGQSVPPIFSDTFDLSGLFSPRVNLFCSPPEGESKRSPPAFTKQQETVEGKDGAEAWADGSCAGERGRTQTLACDQSREDAFAAAAGPGDSATARERSRWVLQSQGGAESAPEHPGVCQSKAVSVIVCVSGCGEMPDDTVCAAAEEASKERRLTSRVYPGKVITTNVTINSLTVTFKEATMAEGFFNGY